MRVQYFLKRQEFTVIEVTVLVRDALLPDDCLILPFAECWRVRSSSQILSQGLLVKHFRQKVRYQTFVSMVVPVTKDMLPSFCIVAYYHTRSSEVVSDSVWVDVKDSCIGSVRNRLFVDPQDGARRVEMYFSWKAPALPPSPLLAQVGTHQSHFVPEASLRNSPENHWNPRNLGGAVGRWQTPSHRKWQTNTGEGIFGGDCWMVLFWITHFSSLRRKQ